MKTEVYSWRLSPELKAELEREAHRRKVPVSALLETAVQSLLRKRRRQETDEEEQARLHAAAKKCFGTIDNPSLPPSDKVSQAVREKLLARYGR